MCRPIALGSSRLVQIWKSTCYLLHLCISDAVKYQCFELIWPGCDLEMNLLWPWVTLPWSPTHVTMCTSAGLHQLWWQCWSLVQKWQSACYLVHFCHIREGWHKGGLMGYYPSNPYITPITSWFFFDLPQCSGLGGLQPSKTSQMNIIRAKTTNIRYFYPIWADLTLMWPWDDLFMTLG